MRSPESQRLGTSRGAEAPLLHHITYGRSPRRNRGMCRTVERGESLSSLHRAVSCGRARRMYRRTQHDAASSSSPTVPPSAADLCSRALGHQAKRATLSDRRRGSKPQGRTGRYARERTRFRRPRPTSSPRGAGTARTTAATARCTQHLQPVPVARRSSSATRTSSTRAAYRYSHSRGNGTFRVPAAL